MEIGKLKRIELLGRKTSESEFELQGKDSHQTCPELFIQMPPYLVISLKGFQKKES